VAQIVQLLFQSRAGGGLGRCVARPDGNETRTNGDAQTDIVCDFHEMTIPDEP
jgi:hypothetical protein